MMIANKCFKIVKDEITQYFYYVAYEKKRMDFENKERTIAYSKRIGCTIRSNMSFLFGADGFYEQQLESPNQTVTEITLNEWKRVMMQVAIDFGRINDGREFYEILGNIK